MSSEYILLELEKKNESSLTQSVTFIDHNFQTVLLLAFSEAKAFIAKFAIDHAQDLELKQETISLFLTEIGKSKRQPQTFNLGEHVMWIESGKENEDYRFELISDVYEGCLYNFFIKRFQIQQFSRRQ